MMVRAGRELNTDKKELLLQCLTKNQDIFSWSYTGMLGIDPQMACHRLYHDHVVTPVKQQKCLCNVDRAKIITGKVDQLLQTNFISPVKYPEWLTNMVVVPKKNEKWRECINFRDLDKVCLKDSFPLPKIDHVIDSMEGLLDIMI